MASAIGVGGVGVKEQQEPCINLLPSDDSVKQDKEGDASKGKQQQSKRSESHDIWDANLKKSIMFETGITLKPSYRDLKPTAIDTTFSIRDPEDLESDMSRLQAPRNVTANYSDQRFFPSPTSVLERRTSSGSFF
jgi:hypothetical protein